MRRNRPSRIIPGLILVCCFVICPVVGLAGGSDSDQRENQLLSIGQPGPKAADLQVRTEKAKGESAKAAMPATVRIKSAEKAYLTAIYLSPGGDIIVLLPNKAMPADPILPDKEYTLFGPESPVKLKESDIAKDARIIFYVSSEPLQIEPLETPSGETFVRIPQSSPQGMQILIKKLTSLSQDPKFNRKALALRDRDRQGSRLDLMGLPKDVTSGKPVGVTGVQGAKEKILEPDKE